MGKGAGGTGAARAGKAQKNEQPSLLIGDSMCAKNTDTADKHTKGYCWYKATNGIKRHLLVDVLGNPFFVVCTKASVSDDEGLLEIVKQHKEYFLQLPFEHRLTILLDNGYHKEYLEQQLEQIDPLLCQRIGIELSAKPTPQQRAVSKQENPAKQGFVVIKKRVPSGQG